MYMVAEHTSALETVVLNFFFIYDVCLLRVFNRLVQRNPKIESIHIGDTGIYSYSTTRRILQGFVTAFTEAPALRVRVVEMSNVVRLEWEVLCELAQPLRHRCISFRFLFDDATYGDPSVYVE